MIWSYIIDGHCRKENVMEALRGLSDTDTGIWPDSLSGIVSNSNAGYKFSGPSYPGEQNQLQLS